MLSSPDAPMENNTEAVCTEEVPIHTQTKRVPKRILHFSDGTLEEFSSDEEEIVREKVAETQLAPVDPATMNWAPWLYYQSSYMGYKALAACDYLGGHLANFFGILSPKYEYEIEHYKKTVAEEEEKRKQDLELGSWNQKTSEIVSSDPKNHVET